MDLLLDADRDLAFVAGQLVTVQGADATAQRLGVKLRTWLGEWYLDQRVGVPYVRDWLVKNPNLRLITSQIREIAMADPGVKSINRMAIDLDRVARTFRVDAEFVGNDGEPFALAFSDAILGSEQQ